MFFLLFFGFFIVLFAAIGVILLLRKKIWGWLFVVLAGFVLITTAIFFSTPDLMYMMREVNPGPDTFIENRINKQFNNQIQRADSLEEIIQTIKNFDPDFEYGFLSLSEKTINSVRERVERGDMTTAPSSFDENIPYLADFFSEEEVVELFAVPSVEIVFEEYIANDSDNDFYDILSLLVTNPYSSFGSDDRIDAEYYIFLKDKLEAFNFDAEQLSELWSHTPGDSEVEALIENQENYDANSGFDDYDQEAVLEAVEATAGNDYSDQTFGPYSYQEFTDLLREGEYSSVVQTQINAISELELLQDLWYATPSGSDIETLIEERIDIFEE